MDRKQPLYARMYMGQMTLPMPAITRYAASRPEQRYFAGEMVFPDENMFIIVVKQGKFNLCVEKADGSLFVYTQTMPGCCIKCSESILLPNQLDTPIMIAAENSVITSFSRDDFYALVSKDKAVFDEMMDFSTFFSHLLRERLLIVGGLPANIRLLTWLDRLCECYPQETDGSFQIACDLTQQQIADLLFIHISTCNKLFSSLEKEKIAVYRRREIKVCRRDKIKQIISRETII